MTQSTKTRLMLTATAACALVLGTTVWAAKDKDDDDKTPINMAIAVLSPTQGNKVTGMFKFRRMENGGIHVTGHVEGLTPGDHGFHIHEFGDCSAADGTSAGGHYNPEGHHHAGPDANKRHAGDLGNLTANNHGVAKYDREFPDMKFRGQTGIIGRSIIVHEKADDLKTQPTGGAGARVACGVIGVAKD